MQLYVGTTTEFIDDAVQHRLAEVLSDRFYDYYGYRAVSELQSWQNSLTAMALQLRHANMLDQGIVVEMELPLSSARLDCLIFGRDRTDRASAMLVELKQWSHVRPSDVDGFVLTFVGGKERDEAHPSLQALTYAEYLEGANEVYDGAVALRPASFLHNMLPADATHLRSPQFAELLERAPMFIGRDADEFAAALNVVLGHGGGEAVMQAALSAPPKPSRKLLEHTAAMIAGEPRYTLLDEQLLAYRAVLAEVRRAGRTKTEHSVVVVKGGPGTGKSVIALNLVGTLAQSGIDVRHATGSRAFTETLWRVVGSRAKPQFRYFNHFGEIQEAAIDVLICDEAHRIRKTSNHRYTPAHARSERLQVEELIRAAKVSVFFIDDLQAVRPDEIGSSALLRERAASIGARYRQIDLRNQFRCAGSDSYVQWIDQLLEIRKTGTFVLPPDDPFEFEIMDTPAAVDERIREKLRDGQSARMVAGFCWKWSMPDSSGRLVDDVVVGDYRRPWNARPEATKLAQGIPKAPLWAWTAGGVDQVGCIYTAQGFEFDYVGVIFGNDLVIRNGQWVGQPSVSRDPMKRTSGARFVDCVKNAYRVLMTRGLKGCFVTFLDEETRRFVAARAGMDSNRTASA